MKRALISQPMHGLDDIEIARIRARAIHEINKLGYTAVESVFDFNEKELARNGISSIPVYYLAKSIEALSMCTAVYMCKGWETARGCIIEHDIAKAYKLKVIYE